jgi:very-short-patch-repair endonuclease
MAEGWQSVSTPRKRIANLRAVEVAAQQWGVIGWRQLQACGVSGATASRWRKTGRLHSLYSGVDALGHPSVPVEGRMVAALLVAGDSAVLSHATAAWWWELIDREPALIHVSSPRRLRSPDGVWVHRRSALATTRHRRFPITSLPQTFLDLAATQPLNTIRRALAEADYRGILDTDEVAAAAGQGKPGSAALRAALKRHQPQLAHTRSELERAFLAMCEAARLPLPEFNQRVKGWTVDAVWRDYRLIVELDGYDNHHTPAQVARDRRKDLALRAAGFVVLRYTWEQLHEDDALVLGELLAHLT